MKGIEIIRMDSCFLATPFPGNTGNQAKKRMEMREIQWVTSRTAERIKIELGQNMEWHHHFPSTPKEKRMNQSRKSIE